MSAPTTAPSAEFQNAGKPVANPFYLVDTSGNPLSSANGMTVTVATPTLFTTAQTTVGSGTSGDLDVSKLREVAIDITTTAQAGTSPTIQFFWERKGADGNYYVLWQSAIYSAAANTISTSVGAGMSYAASLGVTGRLRWVVGGSAASWTFTPNIVGK